MLKTLNVYCDESCHIENDHIPAIAWGSVTCEKRFVPELSKKIRKLKTDHGLGSDFEAKWIKISPAKKGFYLALVDLFIEDDRLRFRGLATPRKNLLRHENFKQSHDEWYYKMYFLMLRHVLNEQNDLYNIYLDIKDTKGGPKMRKLQECLANQIKDFDQKRIKRMQQVRSHESELLQITDILVGSLTYANRGLNSNTAKTDILNRLRKEFGKHALTETSDFSANKFNILLWQPQQMNGTHESPT